MLSAAVQSTGLFGVRTEFGTATRISRAMRRKAVSAVSARLRGAGH